MQNTRAMKGFGSTSFAVGRPTVPSGAAIKTKLTPVGRSFSPAGQQLQRVAGVQQRGSRQAALDGFSLAQCAGSTAVNVVPGLPGMNMYIPEFPGNEKSGPVMNSL